MRRLGRGSPSPSPKEALRTFYFCNRSSVFPRCAGLCKHEWEVVMPGNAFRGMLVLVPFLVGFACPATAAPEARVSETYGKLPLHFEANQGQTHQDVRFLARGAGYSLYLTAGVAVLILTEPDPNATRHSRRTSGRLGRQPLGGSVVLVMSLMGAAPKPLVSGLDEL